MVEVKDGVGEPLVFLDIVFVAPGTDTQSLFRSKFLIRLDTVRIMAVGTLSCPFLRMNRVLVYFMYVFVAFYTHTIVYTFLGYMTIRA